MAEFTPINTQEELNAVIAARITREREKVTQQFQTQIAERDEKITGYESTIAGLNQRIEQLNTQGGRVAELEAQVRAYEINSVKMRVAQENQLPLELADRLSGTDEAAIRADAEALRKLFKAQTVAPMRNPDEGLGDGKDAALKNLLANVRGK